MTIVELDPGSHSTAATGVTTLTTTRERIHPVDLLVLGGCLILLGMGCLGWAGSKLIEEADVPI
jgi:hypothetical protein